MEASEAALWFSNTPLSGWNGSAWVANVSYGDFHTYDRFITERTFGAKKRIFLCHESKKFSPSTYPMVKTPDGSVWIVVSDNFDIDGLSPYARSFLLLRAAFTASILTLQTTLLASGQRGTESLVVTSTSYCDVEQYGTDFSDEFKQVMYGTFKIVLPHGTSIGDDNEIQVDGSRYVVQEVFPELLTTVVRALKRGAG